MTSPVRLPLFPLQSVLVPGLLMPLHIFEERYRILIEALLELPEDERRFGTIALKYGAEADAQQFGASQLYPVGCTAVLREVTRHPDGTFHILAVGESRFTLEAVDASAHLEDAPTYTTGLIHLLNDDLIDSMDEDALGQDPLHRKLLQSVSLEFARYRDLLGVDQSPLPRDPRMTSYLITAAVFLDRHTKQGLLAEPTTRERLKKQIRLLRQETRLIGHLQAIPALELPEEGRN